MKYGTEKESTNLDDIGSTLTLIRKIRDYEMAKVQKQFNMRTKVYTIQDVTTEMLKHQSKIEQKRKEGVLVMKDDDPSTRPAFYWEYPKHNTDGAYFVVSSWTEVV